MEATVAALEAAPKKNPGAASAAATEEAAGAAKPAMAAMATAEQAAAEASSTTKEALMGAEAAAEVSLDATAKEVAADMRYSNKRKFHQIDDEGRGGGSRDDGESLDLISALPDELIGNIISFIPTKDGARTQAISRWWLPLWRSAPLNLVAEFEPGRKKRKLIASVSKILLEHRGPARRLLLQVSYIPERGWELKVDGWLHSRALDSLQELNFTYNLDMPLSVFRLAPTPRVARLSSCDFPESISALCLNFPCLKQLTLFVVTITDDGLHSLLSGCTALESLELSRIPGIRSLCISSQTLRSLGLYAYCKYDVILRLVIKDAPSLERLVPLYRCNGRATTIRVIQAPKLELLVLLSEGIFKVQFGTTIFQKMIAVSLSTKMHNMKVLVLRSIGPNLDAVVDFLECFPCLVKLYVISHPTKGMNNARKYDPLDPIECLELHLRKVALMNYDGNKRPSVDFAKFFVLNAKLLKEMEIKVLNHRSDEWMATQHRQLRVENRASRDARIELKIDTKKSFMHDVDSHDLSMADPFDNRSFY